MAESGKKTRAIAALLSENTVEAAAVAAGVPARTLHRWLVEDEDFREALRAAQNRALSEHVAGLVAALGENRRRMIELRDNAESESVQLRACALIDEHLRTWLGLVELEQRIAAIEQSMGSNQHFEN